MWYLKLVDRPYDKPDAIKTLYEYMSRSVKTYGLIGCYNALPEEAIYMMKHVKRLFGKDDGRQLLHIIISLSTDANISEEAMFRISSYIASYFYKHQVVFSVHSDTPNIHTHFMVNTISFLDGSRLTDDEGIKRDIHNICEQVFGPQS